MTAWTVGATEFADKEATIALERPLKGGAVERLVVKIDAQTGLDFLLWARQCEKAFHRGELVRPVKTLRSGQPAQKEKTE